MTAARDDPASIRRVVRWAGAGLVLAVPVVAWRRIGNVVDPGGSDHILRPPELTAATERTFGVATLIGAGEEEHADVQDDRQPEC